MADLSEIQLAMVEYVYGPYSGTVHVTCHGDDDNEAIAEKLWAQFRRQGLLMLPMAAKRATVISRG